MPAITVDDGDGSSLHYEDTGPPSVHSDDYLTIVFLHGLGINGKIFQRVLPLAANYHARFVVVNSREYAGSSSFLPEHVEALRSGVKDTQATVIAKLGHELAIFLSRFIQTHNIPKISQRDGKRDGGLAIVAWSQGSLTLLSFLAHAQELSEDLRTHLAKYLRTVVSYDCALSAYGTPPPPDFPLSPFKALDTSPEERFAVFIYYASAYQTPVESLQEVSIPYLLGRTDTKEVTLMQMSRQDFDEVVDRRAFEIWALFARALPAVQENLSRAYFQPEGIWMDVDVKVFWVDSGSWGMLWGAKNLADRVASWTSDMRRSIPKTQMHWEEPERFTSVLMKHLA